jgi:hypothetical protein
MADLLGSIGARVDLLVRAGKTLGPFLVEETDALGAPIPLTGIAFDAALSRIGEADGDVPITVTPVDLPNGKYSFEVPYAATASLAGGDFFRAEATYAYRLDIVDSVGRKYPRYYGHINVAQGSLS